MTDKTPHQLLNECKRLDRDLKACRSKNMRYLTKIAKLTKKLELLEEKLNKAKLPSRFFSVNKEEK